MLELYSFPFAAMGTDCNLYFYATEESRAEEIAALAISEAQRIEGRYSRYNPDSLLSKINRVAQAGGSIEVDEETGDLLDHAFRWYLKSGRLFDISSGVLRKAWGDFSANTLPDDKTIKNLLPGIGFDKILWTNPGLAFLVPGMELDFGGIGKEYAADRMVETCIAQGVLHGLVNLGGDINVIGPHPDNDPWLVDIRHPRQAESSIATIELSHGALASSGDYERCIDIDGVRYGHIISPLTGWPVRGLTSVSVIAGRCMEAGSISTVAMLKGVGGIQWLAELGLPHLWVDEFGKQGGSLAIHP